MNATFQTIDPGSQDVLATVSEMGEAEVDRAVAAASRASQGNGGNGWRDADVEKRISQDESQRLQENWLAGLRQKAAIRTF